MIPTAMSTALDLPCPDCGGTVYRVPGKLAIYCEKCGTTVRDAITIPEGLTLWSIDKHCVAHTVKERGPSCHVSHCGQAVFGPFVAEIADTTPRCHKCQKAAASAGRPSAVEQQGRLF